MSTRSLRCAVYTRKSTEEGLAQDFNSLDAQREACEAFIHSQKHEGWRLVETRYDDGGWSGATMDRPGLRLLLDDIRAGRIDVVVVYKIDRLTRSLGDFARMVEVFEAGNVSFVSVTQAFNTTTSMGRLTLNVLLSFAQFEREVTAERIRDKIAASKRKGMWMGGLPPLGYAVRDRQLVVDPAEAGTVRTILPLYLELGSVRRLRDELDRRGIVTRLRTRACGRTTGGGPFSRGHLYRLLSNPVYVGRIAHRGATYPGRHEAIIDRGLWDAVQRQLADNGSQRRRGANVAEASLLTGLVLDDTGDRLSPSHAVKQGRRYRYYISRRLMEGPRSGSDGWRIPARQLETLVCTAVTAFLRNGAGLVSELRLPELRSLHLQTIVTGARDLADRIDEASPPARRALLPPLLHRIDLAPGTVTLQLDRPSLLRCLDAADTASALPGAPIELALPVALRRRGVEARLVIEGGSGASRRSSPDAALIDMIARPHQWLAALASGEAASINDIATRQGVHPSDATRALPLAFLAPDIVAAIVEGRHPVELTANRLKTLCPLPCDWAGQRRILGFPAPSPR